MGPGGPPDDGSPGFALPGAYVSGNLFDRERGGEFLPVRCVAGCSQTPPRPRCRAATVRARRWPPPRMRVTRPGPTAAVAVPRPWPGRGRRVRRAVVRKRHREHFGWPVRRAAVGCTCAVLVPVAGVRRRWRSPPPRRAWQLVDGAYQQGAALAVFIAPVQSLLAPGAAVPAAPPGDSSSACASATITAART